MTKALIDDDLWIRIEPLLPKRRRRNRRYAGRRPIADRAVLTGILFVLRSGIPWNMLPREMGCGSGTTCWRRLLRWQRAGVWKRLHAVLLAELCRRGQLDLARAVVDSASLRALRGGKKLDRTLPIAAKPGRNIMFSPTRTGFRSSRRDGREPARPHPVAPARRCDAAAGRARRPTRAEAAADPRRPRIRFAAPSRPAPAARDRVPTRPAPNAARQRPGSNPVGRRAYAGLAASASPLGRAVRAPTVYA